MKATGERLAGGLLVATAAAIPIGEGLAYVCAAALAVATAGRWRTIATNILLDRELRPILVGLGLWLGAGLFASLFAGGFGAPGRWAPVVGLPLVLTAAAAVDRKWLRHAAVAFVVALVAAALFGSVQELFNFGPGEFLVRTDAIAVAQGRVPGDLQRRVAGGFYFHRLKLAHVLLIGLAGMGARLIFQPGGRGAFRSRLLLRFADLAALAVFSVALWLTHSRAAWVAFFAGAAVLLATRLGRGPWLALLVIAALVGIFPSAGSGVARRQDTLATRALIWSQALTIVADHPLGVGYGRYREVGDRYLERLEPGLVPPRAEAHSMVLTVWAETGPIGLVGFALLWLGFAQRCFRRLADPSASPGRKRWAATGLAAASALWAAGWVHDVLFHDVVALAYFCLVGAVWTGMAPAGKQKGKTASG